MNRVGSVADIGFLWQSFLCYNLLQRVSVFGGGALPAALDED